MTALLDVHSILIISAIFKYILPITDIIDMVISALILILI